MTVEVATADHGLGFIRLDDHGAPYEMSPQPEPSCSASSSSTPAVPPAAGDLEWLARDRCRARPAELILHRRDGRRLIVHRALPASVTLSCSPRSHPRLDTLQLGLTAREAAVLELVRPGTDSGRRGYALEKTFSAHSTSWASGPQAIALLDEVGPIFERRVFPSGRLAPPRPEDTSAERRPSYRP